MVCPLGLLLAATGAVGAGAGVTTGVTPGAGVTTGVTPGAGVTTGVTPCSCWQVCECQGLAGGSRPGRSVLWA
jgi:hypothetical protein